MLNASESGWIIIGITGIMLLILLPLTIKSMKLRRSDKSGDASMGIGHIVLYIIFLSIFLIRISFGLIFEATGNGSLNTYGWSVRATYFIFFLVIILFIAVINFGVISRKSKICCVGKECGDKNAHPKYCPASVAMFFIFFVLFIPLLFIPFYITMNGGEGPASKDELLLAIKLEYLTVFITDGQDMVQHMLNYFGLADRFTILLVKQAMPNDARILILKENSTEDVYILITGTVSDTNWLNDFKFIPTPLTTWYLGEPIKSMVEKLHVSTHLGFLDTYNDAQPYINNFGNPDFSVIQEYLVQAPKIHYVGHSLGGAVITLAAFHMASTISDYSKTSSEISIITFGSPQVLDLNGVQIFNTYIKESTRTVTPFDPVPHALDSQLPHVEKIKVVCPYNLLKAIWPSQSHRLGVYEDSIRATNVWLFILFCFLISFVIMIIVVFLVWLIQNGVYILVKKL